MSMVHLVKRIISIIILLTAFSCGSDRAEKEQLLEDLAQKRMIFTKYTVSHFGETQYLEFYNTVNDTLQSWIENELTVSKMQRFSNWKLDSLMCFNMSKNKCVMAIVNQESETVNNSINFLYGAKIKKKWYFFYGPTMYPDPSNHTTLSFSKLHEIAMGNIFKGYLKKNRGNGR